MPNISDMPTAVAHTETDYYRPILELADGTAEQVPQQNVQMSVGAENGSHEIIVTGQAYDYNDILERATELTYYIASDALGTTVSTLNAAVTATTGTLIEEYTTKVSGRLVTDADGVFALVVTGVATTLYLVIQYGGSGKQFIATLPYT
jgi:hypothetical protein